MAGGIRTLRQKHGLSQAELAARLSVDKLELSKWERNWEKPPPWVVKELAIMWYCRAEDVLGREIPVDEWRHCPYAVSDNDGLYGTVTVKLTTGTVDYPIAQRARKSLLSQLGQMEVIRDRGEDGRRFFYFWTLDNLMVFVNPRFVRRLDLECDDIDAPPLYAHPEVYRTLEEWDLDEGEGMGPLLLQACRDEIARHESEADAIRPHSCYRIVDDRGEATWEELADSEDAFGLFGFDLSCDDVPENTFVRIASEGYSAASFVNMSNIALLEVPASRWHRLNAPEEREEGDDGDDDRRDDETDVEVDRLAPSANDNRLGVVAGGMSEADRIRTLVERDYFAPARAVGVKVVEITAREIHDRMGYQARFPVVCNALGGRRIEERCGVTIVDRQGPAASSSTVFRYKLA